MPIKISTTKEFDNPVFDTFVPQLTDNADIQDALELFYYGKLESGNSYDTVNSIYAHLLSLKSGTESTQSSINGHVNTTINVHGIQSGSQVVGTTDTQTLTNKTLTNPVITLPASGAGLSPVGSIVIHAGSSAPTGWFLCDGASYSTVTYSNLFNSIGYQFGGSGTSFNVPNLKGRVVVGIDGAQTQFDVRGETGGEMTHQHSASNSGETAATTGSLTANSGGANAGNNTSGHTFNAGNDATTSNNSANHTHSVNPPETNTNSAGSHNHSSINAANNINAGVYATVADNVNAGSHSHSVNIATLDSGNQSANHTHTVDDHYHTTIDHSHSIAHGHTSTHTHTTPASSSLSNLQPYMALNYIIKH